MRTALWTAVFAVAPTLALACPETEGGRRDFVKSGSDLWSPMSVEIVAGGPIDLTDCIDVTSIEASGWIIKDPDVEIEYLKDEEYDLVFRVDGECDTVLLINDPDGSYFYSDDLEGNSDPYFRFSSAEAGIYDVWVGTFDGGECDASLIVETFDAHVIRTKS